MHPQKLQFEMAAWQDGAACIRMGPERMCAAEFPDNSHQLGTMSQN